MKITAALLIVLSYSAVVVAQSPLDVRLAVVDPIINDAIEQQQIPGAVLIVGHNGQVVYRKAYGSRAIIPHREAMAVDTIFDCASLTKVVVTTTALMQLWEQGKFRTADPVAKYLPEFAQNGKQDITIRQLLVHYSGLPKDLDLVKKWRAKTPPIAWLSRSPPTSLPVQPSFIAIRTSSCSARWWNVSLVSR